MCRIGSQTFNPYKKKDFIVKLLHFSIASKSLSDFWSLLLHIFIRNLLKLQQLQGCC